ncbi:MAG TPA: TonB-dependent receptor [Rhizomicrobium sp.]|nr:TonB-dependent receptor [Rhizomicrobium sp.]
MAYAIGTAPAALAQGQGGIDPFSLSPEQLFDATVMSVSKTSENLRDAPAAIYVLSGEDIARSGATSIPEALRAVPGLQVARINASGWAISVRGFNNPLANKLLVLIDGREVYDPLFSGVYWDVQDLPLQDVERIEVIRGPGASLWGANAVNGVINIITKNASDTKGALVSVASGNEDRAIITARYGGDIGEDAQWRIYGKYLNRAPFETPTGADANDEWSEWRGGFRVDWNPNAGSDRFNLQGDVYGSDDGDLRSMPMLVPPYAVVEKDNVSASGANLHGTWSRELGDDSRFSLGAYVDFTRRRQITLKDERSALDIEGQYEFPAWDRHKLIIGALYRYTVDALTATPIITFAKGTRGDNLVSGFLQDKITLEADRWIVTLGSKFEHNDYSGFEAQPTARLQWLDGKTQMAWASVSRAVRTPTQLEQDLDILSGVIPPGMLPLPIAVELRPSPDFRSERLVAYELGYRRQLMENVQLDISGFYNDYDRLSTLSLMPPEIVLSPFHIVLPIATTNLTKAKTFGFEAVANWRAGEHINFSAAYSYLHMNLDGPPSNLAIASEAAEGQSPRHQFNVRAQWNVDDGLSLDSALYYVDSLPAFPVSAYWRLDTRIAWQVTDDLELELVGQNILDGSHREFGPATDANATVIGRSVYGRFTWRS